MKKKSVRSDNRFFRATEMAFAVIDSSINGKVDCQLHMHNHDFEELVIVYEGSAMHVSGGMECKISCGDVFFIPPGYYHGFHAFNDYKALNFLFIREQLYLPDFEIRNSAAYYALFELEPELRLGRGSAPCLSLNNTELMQVKSIAEQINKEQELKKNSYKYKVLSLFMELEVLLVRAYENIESSTSRTLIDLGNFINFLEHNYKRKICIRDMAKAINTSVRTLNRLCNEILNCSPKKYLVDFRLSKAKQMLHENKLTVTQIAYETGFTDSNYFTKQYKKKFFCTPKESKKIH